MNRQADGEKRLNVVCRLVLRHNDNMTISLSTPFPYAMWRNLLGKTLGLVCHYFFFILLLYNVYFTS